MSGFFQSIGDALRGDSSNDGERHVSSEGASYTRGPAEDKSVPRGSTYFSVTDKDGDKRTKVYGPDGKTVKDTGWRRKG